jgi:mRNA interferase MazF
MPNRGEVWLVDLGMAEKVRPALIINVPFADSDRALYTVVPRTTALRGSRFEIAVEVPSLKPGAFLVQNPVTIPPPRLVRMLGKLTEMQMAAVEVGIKDWFGLK